MKNDPALGRNKSERALGVSPEKKSLKPLRSRVNEFRNVNVGMFSGPGPTYGRYNVSEQASDILNKSLNKKTR